MATFMLVIAVSSLVLALGGGIAEAKQKMFIDIGVRSYNGQMMHCNDGFDRPVPAGGDWSKLPFNEQPKMRPTKNGGSEPYIADDGNAWVAFVSRDHERRAFAVSSDGFEAVWSKFQTIRAIEDVAGDDYIQEIQYKTVETNYETLEQIAQEIAGRNAINHKEDQTYRGTDYVIDLVLRVVTPEARAELMKSANNWPVALQLLDDHYFKRLGESAFTRRNIPRGTVPLRTQLDSEPNLLHKRFDPRKHD